MNKYSIFAVGVGAIIILGAIMLREKFIDTQMAVPTQMTNNITMEGEKQVVMIDAKGDTFRK